MKVIVISDIHGNCVALDTVLADIQHESIDKIVCLGDAIQGGPQPAEVVQRLQMLGCLMVMGNADAWLLNGEETGEEVISAERLQKLHVVRAWSLTQLSAAALAFIGNFRPTITIGLSAEHNLLCFHGSPNSFDDLILPSTPEDAFQRLLNPYTGYLLSGGHTHLQQIRRLGDGFFFNPGSVGLAYNHQQNETIFRTDPWAEYAVLSVNDGRVRLEFRRVPFDVEALMAAYRNSGHPYVEEAVVQYTQVGSSGVGPPV